MRQGDLLCNIGKWLEKTENFLPLPNYSVSDNIKQIAWERIELGLQEALFLCKCHQAVKVFEEGSVDEVINVVENGYREEFDCRSSAIVAFYKERFPLVYINVGEYYPKAVDYLRLTPIAHVLSNKNFILDEHWLKLLRAGGNYIEGLSALIIPRIFFQENKEIAIRESLEVGEDSIIILHSRDENLINEIYKEQRNKTVWWLNSPFLSKENTYELWDLICEGKYKDFPGRTIGLKGDFFFLKRLTLLTEDEQYELFKKFEEKVIAIDAHSWRGISTRLFFLQQNMLVQKQYLANVSSLKDKSLTQIDSKSVEELLWATNIKDGWVQFEEVLRIHLQNGGNPSLLLTSPSHTVREKTRTIIMELKGEIK